MLEQTKSLEYTLIAIAMLTQFSKLENNFEITEECKSF